jgi:hypothetical protein
MCEGSKASRQVVLNQRQPKHQLVARPRAGRVYAQIAACDTGEHTWESAVGNSCDAFVREKEKDDTFVWFECPSVEQLSKHRPSSKTVEPKRRGRAGFGGADADTHYDPQLSLSEFGRLMCVLVDVPTCRNSLIQSGQDLTRAEQDALVGRDDFWGTAVEVAFNDPDTVVAMSTAGYIAGVDVTAAPLAHRTIDKLKKMFYSIRGMFTRIKQRRSVSGNNDSDPHDVVRFLPVTRGRVSTESQRVHHMFIAMRMGTPEVDDTLVTFSRKIVPSGVAYDYMSSAGDEDRATARRKRVRLTRIADAEGSLHLALLIKLVEAPIFQLSGGGETAGFGRSKVDDLMELYGNVKQQLRTLFANADEQMAAEDEFHEKVLRNSLEELKRMILMETDREN